MGFSTRLSCIVLTADSATGQGFLQFLGHPLPKTKEAADGVGTSEMQMETALLTTVASTSCIVMAPKTQKGPTFVAETARSLHLLLFCQSPQTLTPLTCTGRVLGNS